MVISEPGCGAKRRISSVAATSWGDGLDQLAASLGAGSGVVAAFELAPRLSWRGLALERSSTSTPSLEERSFISTFLLSPDFFCSRVRDLCSLAELDFLVEPVFFCSPSRSDELSTRVDCFFWRLESFSFFSAGPSFWDLAETPVGGS